MPIPHDEITRQLNEPFRKSQSRQATLMYCRAKGMSLSEVSIPILIDWIRLGLTKDRAGCSGKERYPCRKAAKQKLKTYKRFDGDGVYECLHCRGWHITSKLLPVQGEAFVYYLYGERLD